jgi:Leucine-rich repeat (LRR) protein
MKTRQILNAIQDRIAPGGLISDLSSAKIISLGSNPISIIPQGFFSSVKELQVLDLHSTQIGDSVLDSIQNLSSLFGYRLMLYI